MTKTLFLAWQDKRYQATDASATRQWFPIGRLDADSDGFVFRYTHGAKRAQQQAGFQQELTQTTDAYHMLGCSPRYLVEDLVQAIATAPSEIAATIQQINRPPAPANQRALVSLEGNCLPV